MLDSTGRALVAFAGLLGAIGVATAAQASHGADPRLVQSIATISLAHAPALLALGLFTGEGRALRWAGLLLAGGTLLFIADLVARMWLGHGLFPGAAPLGGGLMVLGWLGVAAGALLTGRFNFR